MIQLTRITIYPFKSLDGVSLDSVEVLPTGSLVWDRRFSLVDLMGRTLNAKRFEAFHRIHSTFDLDAETITIARKDQPEIAAETFSLRTEINSIAAWFGEFLGTKCCVIENTVQGFPDDADALGPTLISTGSLREVSNWFGNFDIEEARRRFRMNLEFDTPIPFWEDRLVGAAFDRPVRFSVGNIQFFGQKICVRCPVPTRASATGLPASGFAKFFAAKREETLPTDSPRERFDHFYRLGINTSLASLPNGARLQIGDAVHLL